MYASQFLLPFYNNVQLLIVAAVIVALPDMHVTGRGLPDIRLHWQQGKPFLDVVRL